MKAQVNILFANSECEFTNSILKLLLSGDSNWNIHTVYSGKHCLEIVNNENHPDAIILGMKLGDTTGLELTERIRDYSDIPIILLSNESGIYTLVKAFDSGVNDYIMLPFNEQIFLARLKAVIRRSNWDKQTKSKVCLK